MLTYESLIATFSYSHDSGVLTWNDVPRLGPKRPAGRVAGSLDAHGYIQIGVFKKTFKAHRLVWFYVTGEMPRQQIDHINGIRTDNRFCNLRVVTNAINSQNKRSPLPSNKSGFLGVSWNRGAWRATIQVNHKQINIGRYADPSEAHVAYLNAKRIYHDGCTI
jgi:hypothetical protein